MPRYIDADELRRAMYEEAFGKDSDEQRWDGGCWIRYKMFERTIDSQPTADVVPVKRGKWLLNTVRDEWQMWHSDPECSLCGFHPYYYHDFSVMNYCPNCGAKMEAENDGI